MNMQDLFVGGVACVLGLGAVAAAVFNWDWFYRLKKAQWLEARCGRAGARWTFASIGLLLILLGVTVAYGMRWPTLEVRSKWRRLTASHIA